MRLNALDWVSQILILIGGLNWGLVGLFQYDLIAALFGPMSAAGRVIYIIVGIAAIVEVVSLIMKVGYGAVEDVPAASHEERHA